MTDNILINDIVKRAKEAQKIYEGFNQTQVDSIVKELALIVYQMAEPFAKMAVEETGMGVYADKVAKCKGKSSVIWNHLKNKKSVGIIDEDHENKMLLIAKPIGVVGAITPCTNPIVTIMCNAMFSLKGRNAIIIAPHPRGKICGKYLVQIYRDMLERHHAPADLIQIIEEPSLALSELLMKNVDTVIATGGMGVVKVAYSSGKPAFGVGAGNVQCIIDNDVDINETVAKIIIGRTFDNGIICSGEQSVIAPKDNYSEIIQEFINQGAFYVDDETMVEKFRKALFINGNLNKNVVGQSARRIALIAQVEIPENTKVIMLKADENNPNDLLRKEKMCPVLSCFEYDTFEQAVQIAQTNLEIEGKGHSCALHSNNMEHIKYMGENVTVSRLVINQPSATTAGGSFFNGFAPTTTLGCGTWGNNSISENLDYKHLINISRVGFFNKDVKPVTQEIIWA